MSFEGEQAKQTGDRNHGGRRIVSEKGAHWVLWPSCPGCGRGSSSVQGLTWTHQPVPDEHILRRNYFFSISQEMCVVFQMLRKTS